MRACNLDDGPGLLNDFEDQLFRGGVEGEKSGAPSAGGLGEVVGHCRATAGEIGVHVAGDDSSMLVAVTELVTVAGSHGVEAGLDRGRGDA